MLAVVMINAHIFHRLSLRTVLSEIARVIRGIKHDFPFINIRKVPREVLKTEGKVRREAFYVAFKNLNGVFNIMVLQSRNLIKCQF